MNGPTELQEAQSNAQMWKDRHTLAERQLAAAVDELTDAQTENNHLSAELDHTRNVIKSQDDELTEAQTENERLNGYLIDAFNQRDAAQLGREQAEAQRDRALEQLAESRATGARLEALFSGGPDNVCRTVWHDVPALLGQTIRIECVEVPLADLREAFGSGAL